jgi:hypothetical protein
MGQESQSPALSQPDGEHYVFQNRDLGESPEGIKDLPSDEYPLVSVGDAEDTGAEMATALDPPEKGIPRGDPHAEATSRNASVGCHEGPQAGDRAGFELAVSVKEQEQIAPHRRGTPVLLNPAAWRPFDHPYSLRTRQLRGAVATSAVGYDHLVGSLPLQVADGRHDRCRLIERRNDHGQSHQTVLSRRSGQARGVEKSDLDLKFQHDLNVSGRLSQERRRNHPIPRDEIHHPRLDDPTSLWDS